MAVTWIRIDWRIRLDALGPQIRLDAFDPQIRLDAFERCLTASNLIQSNLVSGEAI